MHALDIVKGKCPEEVKVIYHQPMKMAYAPQFVETIYELGNNDLIYLFYTMCVFQSVGNTQMEPVQ